MLTWTDDEGDPQYEISRDARQRLEASTDARGRPLEVVTLPPPGPIEIGADEAAGVDRIAGTKPRQPGDRLAASYANFYLANDRVVFPLLDERHDDEAAEILQRLLPRPRRRRRPRARDPARRRQRPLHHPAGPRRLRAGRLSICLYSA